jgi:amino acid transporter
LILTLFAFEGMETALGASGEVRDPNRTLPRALFLAMLFVLALYLGVQLTAQHLLGGGLAHSAAPLAEAAGRVSGAARMVMLVGGGLSMLAWMASDVLGTSRMLFAMGRDGRLPGWLGDLHATSRVPAKAVVAYVVAAFLLAVTGSFLELVVLSSLATVAIYCLACGAAVVLRRRGVALAGVPRRSPGLLVAAGVGLVGMVGMIVAARWQEVAGLAAVIVGSLGIFWVTERGRIVVKS